MALRLSEIDTSTAALRETLWRSSVVAVVAVTKNGKLIAANPAFLQTLGYASLPELQGASLPDALLADADDWLPWQGVTEGGSVSDVELRFVTRDGGHAYLRGSIDHVGLSGGTANHLRGVFVDCTAKRWLDSVSFDAARTEAASSLAAGVAHDLNNLLTVLVGNLYLVAEELRGNQALYDKIKRARDAAKRGSDLTRALLNLARGENNTTATIELARTFDGLVPLLAAALGSRIELKSTVDPRIPLVNANPAQLESAVTNLVINARDALADTNPAKVSIAVALKQVDAGFAGEHGLTPGLFVEIAVTDNGPGMPDDVAGRVFEPFFSTKARNKGNGLGLPMVRLFAEQSGGVVTLSTRPGGGASFRILLPASQSEAASESSTMTMPLSTLPGGSETVAVFAEDGDLRSTVEQILGTLGYKVVLRSMKTDIAATVRETNAAVVILDAGVLSPGAVDKVTALLSERRSVGVVIVGESRFASRLRCLTVPKPFNLMELTRAVRDAIPEGS